MRVFWREMMHAAWLAVFVALAALGVNHLRSDGLPVVAKDPYPIFVPCPETEAEADNVDLAASGTGAAAGFPAGVLLIDARPPERFAEGHIPGALNLPYDELSGVSDEDLARIRGMDGAKQVVVYCDGWEEEADPAVRYEHPPSEFLADDLKSRGLEDVVWLKGGLRAWKERGGRATR